MALLCCLSGIGYAVTQNFDFFTREENIHTGINYFFLYKDVCFFSVTCVIFSIKPPKNGFIMRFFRVTQSLFGV